MKRQHGFTMLELLIAVGVISLAAIATIGFSQLVNARQTGDEVRKQILLVQGAIKELYPDPNRTGLSATTLINARKLPASMVNGMTIVHKGGGSITVAPTSLPGGVANSAYQITVNGVDQKDCSTLAMHLASAFPVVAINGSNFQYPGWAAPTAATAATSCNFSSLPSVSVTGI